MQYINIKYFFENTYGALKHIENIPIGTKLLFKSKVTELELVWAILVYVFYSTKLGHERAR
jgi:hypothetical protein